MDKYFGKKVNIVDIDGQIWIGTVLSYETPADSENGKWWLDVEIENRPDFGELTICEDEISSVNVIA